MIKYILLSLFICTEVGASKIQYEIISTIGDQPHGGRLSEGHLPLSGHTYQQNTIQAVNQGFASHTTYDAHHESMTRGINALKDYAAKVQAALADPSRFSHYGVVNTEIKVNPDYGVLIDPSQISDVEPVFQLQSTGEFRAQLEPTVMVLSKIDPLRTRQYIARDFGIESARLADQSFVAGDHDDAEFYRDLAQGFTELALGLHPVTGLAQSSYEFIRGKSFLGGHELSTFQRGVAFAGVLTLGGGRSAVKLGTLLGKITIHVGRVTHISEAISAGVRFLKTTSKAFYSVKVEGKIAEDIGYKFFEKSASTALNFPADDIYVRVLPRVVAEDVKAGLKHLSRRAESFISTREAIKDVSHDPVKLAERLGLYEDAEGKILYKLSKENDVIVHMKIDRAILADYETIVESEYNMYIAGVGETIGGATEYIVKPDMISRLLKDGKISLDDIKIMGIGE